MQVSIVSGLARYKTAHHDQGAKDTTWPHMLVENITHCPCSAPRKPLLATLGEVVNVGIVWDPAHMVNMSQNRA